MKIATFVILLTLGCGAKIAGISSPRATDRDTPAPVTTPTSQPVKK